MRWSDFPIEDSGWQPTITTGQRSFCFGCECIEMDKDKCLQFCPHRQRTPITGRSKKKTGRGIPKGTRREDMNPCKYEDCRHRTTDPSSICAYHKRTVEKRKRNGVPEKLWYKKGRVLNIN